MVFLGGTCNDSTWRADLIPLLTVPYFDPVVDDWDEAAQQRELDARARATFVLYTITPRMLGVYSIAEVVDDSNKRPERTILCVLDRDGDQVWTEAQRRSLRAVERLVASNGATVCGSLREVAEYVNRAAVLSEPSR